MDMSVPFISSADLAAYTKIGEASLDSDLALIALDSGCQAVRNFCAQPLDQATDTDVWLDGNGAARIRLPRFPVSDIASLVVYTDRTDTAPETLVENTDYVWDGETGIVTRIDGYVFPASAQNIKITYTHGSATVDASARLVALQVAARVYEVGMVENESLGGVSTTWVKGAGQLTPDEKHALHHLRRSS
jgi:hypothetical protein